MMELLGDRLLLKAPPVQDRVGRLWIPPVGTWAERQLQGEIVAIGPEVRDPLLQPGLRVITQRFGQIALGDTTDVWVTRETDVLAVLVENTDE